MAISRITFSVHDYDQAGDIFEEGIFLHFDDVRIKFAGSLEEFIEKAQRLSNMAEEISENYNV